MTRTLVLVPARGGSKGIPGKNLREVCGRPLIVWTIEQALSLREEAADPVDVIVSTDDDAIAAAAESAGAEVPFRRPAELAQDTTPTEPVVTDAIERLAADGRRPDRVMLLQATSPVRLPGTLARALAEYDAGDVDSLVGVVPHAPFLWQQHPDAPPTAAYDVDARLRRQDMTAYDLRYRETGSLYVTRTELYLREPANRLGGRIGLFVMDEVEGIDIDTEHDLALAERQLREASAR
ncbi:acylneuraminate cytidylyltransferase family protein [Alteromonas gracilis]